MCQSLIEIGSKTAEKNSAQTNKQTNKQTDRHYENNDHLAVNQLFNVYETDGVWEAGGGYDGGDAGDDGLEVCRTKHERNHGFTESLTSAHTHSQTRLSQRNRATP